MTKVSEDIRRHRDLEIISIWSPTYLLSLLDYLGDTRLPQLKLISCWTHAQAEKSAEQLRRKFPDTVIQPKGLLLTEAPVTVPWTEAQGCVPLLTETLIEFLDQDRIIPLHKAEIGKEYVVLTSQYNGYLRYNTHDVVRVTGMYHKTPVLEFCGRAGITCDLAGEKLAENVLREVFNDIDGPFLIVPDLTGPLPRYVILHEDLEEYPWDEKLRSIYHYDLARKLNQLQAPVVRKEVNLRRRYLDFFQNEGMNLGDIKERILIHETNLAGRLLAWTEIANPSFQVDLEV